MPLVDGKRIDRWCDSNSLDARAIVRLYLQVCDAAAYAHRNLVIHRDIKPSNVLVDDNGHVHLLDFVIGQFTDAQAERTHTMRSEARRVGKEWFSPCRSRWSTYH